MTTVAWRTAAAGLPGAAWLAGFVSSQLWPLAVWPVGYTIITLLNRWLIESRGLLSGELVFWESARRAIQDSPGVGLGALTSVDPPLVFHLVLLTGSALNAAALTGATALAGLAVLLQRTAPAAWRPLLLFHPALLLAAAQYPSMFLRAVLLIIVVSYLLSYLHSLATYDLLMAALALGIGVLVDRQLWVLGIYLAVGLILGRRRDRAEHLTVLLVTFFPAVFLRLAELYLDWVVSGALLIPRQSPLTALESLGTFPGYDQAVLAAVSGSVAAPSALTASLVRFVPAYLLLAGTAAYQLRSALARVSLETRSAPLAIRAPLTARWPGFVLLLAAPVADVTLHATVGQPSPPSVDVAVLVMAVALFGRYQRIPSLALMLTAIPLGTALVTGLLTFA